MFKRTNSYLLLTMLVLTGFAGKIHSDTLPGKERRQLIQELRSSKGNLSESIEGLSEKQFQHVSRSHGLSIRQCIYHLATLERNLWNRSKTLLQQPATSFVKASASGQDVAFLSAMLDQKTDEVSQYHPKAFEDINEALKQFRDDRQSIVRYVKTTTSNLHNYTVQTAAGTYDVYQLLQLHAKYTEACSRIIYEIKRSPDFPK